MLWLWVLKIKGKVYKLGDAVLSVVKKVRDLGVIRSVIVNDIVNDIVGGYSQHLKLIVNIIRQQKRVTRYSA